MDNGRRLLILVKRWNIVLDEEAEFEGFKNRALRCVAPVLSGLAKDTKLLESIDARYSFLLGLPVLELDTSWKDLSPLKTALTTTIYRQIASANDLSEFAFRLQLFLWVLASQAPEAVGTLATFLKQAVESSPSIRLRIAVKGHEATLYPGGAKILDDALINDPLGWMDSHPKVMKRFVNALHLYLDKDKSKYRNLLDDLRVSLETLLRELLSNRKSLEKQKDPLLKWMDERGAHKQIRNQFWTLLDYYSKYQNDTVKHQEKWEEFEVEHIIYLTGCFMRFLLQLDGSSH